MRFRASGFRLRAPGVGLAALVAGVLATSPTSRAQAPAPTNAAPNPYKTIEGYFKLPEGRMWGSTSAVEIFDQQGKLLDSWPQFSRPSGLFIDRSDMLYSADSESESVARNHDGWKRGIRIGSVKDGKVQFFIPDPVEKTTGTSAAEGVAVDAQGNVYGAEVGPRALKKYVRN